MGLCARLLVPLLFPVAAWAESPDQGNRQKLDLEGSLRTGYFSSSAKLDGLKDVVSGSLWLKSSPNLGGGASMVLEAWIRNDDSFRSSASQGRVREAYFNLSGGDADFRVGKQIIIWGRADRINPTDNLTPRNYTWLTPEDIDQRLGTMAAKMTYRFSGISLTGMWLPRFKPNTLPMAAVPGISFSEPEARGGQGAVKLDHSGGAVDWSASWFSGLDLNPDFQIGTVGASGLNLILTHNRVRILGMDAATVVGRYGLRAEAAYTWTENAGPGDALIKKPFLYLVAGGDRTFFENLNLNIQYYLRQVSNYQNPRLIADPMLRGVAVQGAVGANQIDRFQHGITVRVDNKWLHETLEGELSGVFSLTHKDYAIKPRLIYAFDDKLKGTLGMDIYRGGRDTYFGQLRDMSSVFAEIKYSF